MGDPFTGGNHEEWDLPPCPHVTLTRLAGKGNSDTLVCFDCGAYSYVPSIEFKSQKEPEIGGTVIQTWSNLCVACRGYPQKHTYDEHCLVTRPDGMASHPSEWHDHRMNTSDPDCEED